MKIYTCDYCRYIFRSTDISPACPDCGKRAIRYATKNEEKNYWRDQKILADEIRKGLYAAFG